MTTTTPEAIDTIKAQACLVGRCESFPELAAILMADRYAKKGRFFDAHRVLRTYLKRHPMTPRILAKLKSLNF